MPDAALQPIVHFLQGLGLRVEAGPVADDSFLPGVTLVPHGLRYDPARLLSPGDLLHEAGHLAVLSPAERAAADGTLNASPEDELAAIGWSWAALQHLGLPPAVLFHPEGYKGRAGSLMLTCELGVVPGVPVLSRFGLCRPEAFPHMDRWLR